MLKQRAPWDWHGVIGLLRFAVLGHDLYGVGEVLVDLDNLDWNVHPVYKGLKPPRGDSKKKSQIKRPVHVRVT